MTDYFEVQSAPKMSQIAKSFEKEVIRLRRAFHQIPELGWEEEKTIQLIKEEIKKISEKSLFSLSLVEKRGGLWVDLDVGPQYQRRLFRSDIDGLPITEKTELSFASKHPEKMHACGHDCHAAMLLTALKAIAWGYIQPSYNLRFVWQRAEEITDVQSGGSALVEEGVCKGVSSVYGLHISSSCEEGTFKSKPGIMMSQADNLRVEIQCPGGHVMRPHVGANAIDVMTDIHLFLRGFDIRYLGPNELICFIPTISNAGNTNNIMPCKAELCYSLRHFLSQERLDDFLAVLKKRIRQIIEVYPKTQLSHFQFTQGHPKVINTSNNFAYVEKKLREEGFLTQTIDLLFSGEDFSYYLNECEGSFWILGAMQNEGWDHHTPYFNPSETALWKGVCFWLLLAI